MSKTKAIGINAKCFAIPCDEAQTAAGITLDKYRGKQPMFVVKGLVETGRTAEYSVNGLDFSVGSDTWIFGEFVIGSIAKIEGTMNIDNQRYARKIVVNSPH